MYNKVVLIGRLCAEPNITLVSEIKKCSFILAVNRSYVNKETGKQEVSYVSCVAWRNSAEFLVKYFTKGSVVGVEGEIAVRDYTDSKGKRKVVTEIAVDKIFFTGAFSKTSASNSAMQQELSLEAPASRYLEDIPI